jgi:hypothetical protein
MNVMQSSKYTVEFYVGDAKETSYSNLLKNDGFTTVIYTTIVADEETKAIRAAEAKVHNIIPFIRHKVFLKSVKKVVDNTQST